MGRKISQRRCSFAHHGPGRHLERGPPAAQAQSPGTQTPVSTFTRSGPGHVHRGATPTEKGRGGRTACMRTCACARCHGRVGRPEHGRVGVGSSPAAPRSPPAAAGARPATALPSPRVPDRAARPARPLRAPPGSLGGTDLPATRPSAGPPRSRPRPRARGPLPQALTPRNAPRLQPPARCRRSERSGVGRSTELPATPLRSP